MDHRDEQKTTTDEQKNRKLKVNRSTYPNPTTLFKFDDDDSTYRHFSISRGNLYYHYRQLLSPSIVSSTYKMPDTIPLIKDPSENSDEGTDNIIRGTSAVVLPPITNNAIKSLRASLDEKLVSSNIVTSAFPSNTNLSGMLQSMILRSGQNSQASSHVASRRSSAFDAKASNSVLSGMGSRKSSSIFDQNEELLHPTLMAMSNSAADLSTLGALQGILTAELKGDLEHQVRNVEGLFLFPSLPFTLSFHSCIHSCM